MTTVAAPPAAWAPLEEALRQRRAVRLSYHGRQRVVCPHALGWKNSRPMLLAYQAGGQTSIGSVSDDPHKRWRAMFVDEIERAVLADPTIPWATADNYNPARPFKAIDELAIAISPERPRIDG